MGGSGSGNWYRWSSKGTVEGCHSLDVNWLNRKGYLTPGRWASVGWTRGGEYSGSIGLRAETGRVVLVYSSGSGSNREDVEEPVQLTWTPCNYGGQRPWFICPGVYCGRRVRKLYAAGKYFLCRHCYGLVYQSQQKDCKSRCLSKAQKIRQRLGGSANMMDLFPEKPKGMHWRTYERLWNRAQEAEWRMLQAEAVWIERLQRRVGIR